MWPIDSSYPPLSRGLSTPTCRSTPTLDHHLDMAHKQKLESRDDPSSAHGGCFCHQDKRTPLDSLRPFGDNKTGAYDTVTSPASSALNRRRTATTTSSDELGSGNGTLAATVSVSGSSSPPCSADSRNDGTTLAASGATKLDLERQLRWPLPAVPLSTSSPDAVGEFSRPLRTPLGSRGRATCVSPGQYFSLSMPRQARRTRARRRFAFVSGYRPRKRLLYQSEKSPLGTTIRRPSLNDGSSPLRLGRMRDPLRSEVSSPSPEP